MKVSDKTTRTVTVTLTLDDINTHLFGAALFHLQKLGYSAPAFTKERSRIIIDYEEEEANVIFEFNDDTRAKKKEEERKDNENACN